MKGRQRCSAGGAERVRYLYKVLAEAREKNDDAVSERPTERWMQRQRESANSRCRMKKKGKRENRRNRYNEQGGRRQMGRVRTSKGGTWRERR